MSGQVPEKKKIDWGFWGTIVLAIIGVSLFVSGLVWILTTPRSGFENFGNTAGTRLEDVLKWGTINSYSNNGYKITGRIPNVKRYDLVKNKYFLYPGAYQYLILTRNNENPNSSNSIIYIIPMNVSGKDPNKDEFTANKAFHDTHTRYPSFELNKNISLIPAHTKNYAKISYFYIENMNNIENVNVNLGHSSVKVPLTFSRWTCNTRWNRILHRTHVPPVGYKFSYLENKGINILKERGDEYPLTCPKDAVNLNTRIRGVYSNKNI